LQNLSGAVAECVGKLIGLNTGQSSRSSLFDRTNGIFGRVKNNPPKPIIFEKSTNHSTNGVIFANFSRSLFFMILGRKKRQADF